MQEQQTELLHQHESLQEVNAELEANWKSIHSMQRALRAEEELALSRQELASNAAAQKIEKQLEERKSELGRQERDMVRISL